MSLPPPASPPVRIELGRRYDANELAATLIDRGPVATVEIDGVTVYAITHHEQLREALKNPRVWRRGAEHWKDLASGRIPPDHPLVHLLGPVQSMLTSNDDSHTRQRGVLRKAFTPGRIERLRPVIVDIVEAHLDQMAQAPGHIDLKQALAWPVPIQVIAALLGIPRGDWPVLQDITQRIFAGDSSVMAEAGAFMQRLLAEKQDAPPGQDLTTDIAHAQGAGVLSDSEAVYNLMLMVIAGFETTAGTFTNAVELLLEHPDQLALLTSGQVDWRNAVRAVMWHRPAVSLLPALYPAQETTLGGVTVPEGVFVLLAYGAANRHGARTHAPRVDVTSPPTNPLGFGYGVHRCLGAALGELELQIMLSQLFERFPTLQLDPAQTDVQPALSLMMGYPEQLLVRWTPAE